MVKISVIVPIYNVESYLSQCIDSVLCQTCRDFELILVDDGSPDRCPEICDEYAAKDQRIRVIHKKNGGLSDARNAGLDTARGKYVFFLDGDDTIEPELLQIAASHMEDGLDMVAFDYRHVFADGTKENKPYLEHGVFAMESIADREKFIHQILLTYKIGWEACTRMFVRAQIEEYGLRFADNREIFAEDLYFCLCYCAHVNKVACLDACLYNYRQHEASIMANQKRKSNINRINELGKAVLKYLQQFDDCKRLVENFHTIHYLIVSGQFMFQLSTSEMSPPEFRKAVIEDVADWTFLEKQIRKQLRHRKQLAGCFSRSYREEMICYMQFLVGGSYTWLRIRRLLAEVFAALPGQKE